MIPRSLKDGQRRFLALATSLSGFFAFSAGSGPGCLERVVTVASGGSGGQAAVTTGGTTKSSSTAATSPTVSSASAPPAGGPPSAVAMMTSELPANAMECGFTSMCNPPPDMLFLEIASPANSCQAPLGEMSPSGNYWNRQIGLPAKFQLVGTYQLNDPSVYWSGETHMSGPQSAVGSTSGAPGAGWGSIEITSIDKTQVSFRLMGGPMEEAGDYVAKRCTPLP